MEIIRQMQERNDLTERERMKNCSNTIRKYLFRLLFRIKIMAYYWIVIRCAASVIRMIIPS